MESGVPRVGTNSEADVALVADMCVDLIVRGNVRPQFRQVEQLVDDYEVDIGGSGNVFACQMVKLGLRTAVIGRVGPDVFGQHLMECLSREGVDVSRVVCEPGLKTGIGVTLVEPSDRAILTYLGSIAAVSTADLPPVPSQLCAHWHIASYYLLAQMRNAWPEFLARARQQGVTASLDPNWDPSEEWNGVEELLGQVDVFMPNDAEVRAIARESDVLSAARRLSKLGTMVVVKRGSDGPLAVQGDQVFELHRSVLRPVSGIVDTVGAGDNFDAGFLSAWLSGASISECLHRGHQCAVASLGVLGGIRGQITERQLSNHP